MGKYPKTLGRIEAVWNKLGGEEGVDKFLAGETVVGKPGQVAALTKAKTVTGSIIRVDRSIRPAYPEWVDKIMHPELEKTGPKRFDLAKIDLWLHDGQKSGTVRGQVIYDYLTSNDMLESCLGLADLLAIQKLGIEVFRKHFEGKAVFGWKSVVRSRLGSLHVPCLVEGGGQVLLSRNWLCNGWGGDNPALRFAS